MRGNTALTGAAAPAPQRAVDEEQAMMVSMNRMFPWVMLLLGLVMIPLGIGIVRQRWVEFSQGRIVRGGWAVFWGYFTSLLGAAIFTVILLWVVGVLRP
jgi:hypothetical protein